MWSDADLKPGEDLRLVRNVTFFTSQGLEEKEVGGGGEGGGAVTAIRPLTSPLRFRGQRLMTAVRFCVVSFFFEKCPF
jgi:hypothetical protein